MSVSEYIEQFPTHCADLFILLEIVDHQILCYLASNKCIAVDVPAQCEFFSSWEIERQLLIDALAQNKMS